MGNKGKLWRKSVFPKWDHNGDQRLPLRMHKSWKWGISTPCWVGRKDWVTGLEWCGSWVRADSVVVSIESGYWWQSRVFNTDAQAPHWATNKPYFSQVSELRLNLLLSPRTNEAKYWAGSCLSFCYEGLQIDVWGSPYIFLWGVPLPLIKAFSHLSVFNNILWRIILWVTSKYLSKRQKKEHGMSEDLNVFFFRKQEGRWRKQLLSVIGNKERWAWEGQAASWEVLRMTLTCEVKEDIWEDSISDPRKERTARFRGSL